MFYKSTYLNDITREKEGFKKAGAVTVNFHRSTLKVKVLGTGIQLIPL